MDAWFSIRAGCSRETAKRMTEQWCLPFSDLQLQQLPCLRFLFEGIPFEVDLSGDDLLKSGDYSLRVYTAVDYISDYHLYAFEDAAAVRRDEDAESFMRLCEQNDWMINSQNRKTDLEREQMTEGEDPGHAFRTFHLALPPSLVERIRSATPMSSPKEARDSLHIHCSLYFARKLFRQWGLSEKKEYATPLLSTFPLSIEYCQVPVTVFADLTDWEGRGPADCPQVAICAGYRGMGAWGYSIEPGGRRNAEVSCKEDASAVYHVVPYYGMPPNLGFVSRELLLTVMDPFPLWEGNPQPGISAQTTSPNADYLHASAIQEIRAETGRRLGFSMEGDPDASEEDLDFTERRFRFDCFYIPVPSSLVRRIQRDAETEAEKARDPENK